MKRNNFEIKLKYLVDTLKETYAPQKIRSITSMREPGGKKTLEIWENPTPSEREEALKEYDGKIRYSVFLKEKKVIIWGASEALHTEVLRQLYDIEKWHEDPNIIAGDYIPKDEEQYTIKNNWLKPEDGPKLKWVDKYLPKFSTPNLFEEFLNSFKLKYKEPLYVEVFVDPSQHEMMQVSKEGKFDNNKYVRGIADTNKKLYVFTARAMHEQVYEFLNKEEQVISNNHLRFTAALTPENKKWVMVSFDDAGKYNWDWLVKYNIFFE